MAIELNHRERATLRAVAAGHAEISCSCEPDLFVDGLSCSDQTTTRALVRRGLIEPAPDGHTCGERVPAVLTAAGTKALRGTETVAAA
ncbi:hypothetical protein [Amycolatopsis jiangsuensis]|uniref:Uncharacterized protein n=1 Tax=Amycolatopsis jiangsuensis TaxID=1181879 RepID=A0A840J7I7_9PSEU|nr:hypothetical protein [Amycolatopsis jiangsuensis]MBB4689358.1 hypothetical protein [Amycolatopsis jiangsuensis]